jgi:hypothetical protein
MSGITSYQRSAKGIDGSFLKLGLGTSAVRRRHLHIADGWSRPRRTFLIHDPKAGPDGRIDKSKTLLDAKEEGKIRTAGVSNWYAICPSCFWDVSPNLVYSSGVKHLEEIREASLEMPSVNYIEVRVIITLPNDVVVTIPTAPPIQPVGEASSTSFASVLIRIVAASNR